MMTSEDARRRAIAAWGDAVDAALRAVCRYQGVHLKPGEQLTPDQYRLAWQSSAALAAGLASIAEANGRSELSWDAILELALQEQDESYRRRPVPTPRQG